MVKFKLQQYICQIKKRQIIKLVQFIFCLKFINYLILQIYQAKGVTPRASLKQSKIMAKGQYQSLKNDVQKFCKCSVKIRIIGFVICFSIGWVLSIAATIMLFANHNVSGFAILFSIGQILNITGSCFLATPKTQVKDMFKKKRIWFTMAYLISTVLTIVLAVTLPQNLKFLIFLSLIVEIVSYFFYTLSFIPFGQKILGKIFKNMVDSK